MRGHHPESCPRRALQQGELVVDTSHPLGQRVRESATRLESSQNGTCTRVFNYPNVKKADQIFLKRSLWAKCGMGLRETQGRKNWLIYGIYGHIHRKGAIFSTAVRGVSRVICG